MAAWVRVKENWLLLPLSVMLFHLSGCVGSPAASGPKALAAPTGLSAIAGKSQISLSWNARAGASSYVVKRATVNAGPYGQIASPVLTGYVDGSVTSGTTYFYVVSAVSMAEASGDSSPVSAKATTSAPVVNSVAVSPLSASTNTNGTLTFTANVQGTAADKSVTWSASMGSISAAGGYTAPKSAGTAKITATSNADTTKSASVSVNVTAATPSAPTVTSVAISPASAATTTGGKLAFSATVMGTAADKSVTWSASAGSITSAGSYTASASAGTATITATSNADATKSASVNVIVTVAAPIVSSVTISPASASTTTNGKLTFSATVQGTTPNKSVTWSASSGSITSAGAYIAPASAGTAKITATSNADATKSASVNVTVATPAPPPTPPTPPAPAPTSSSPLPESFFDLSWAALQASHFPTVPFGGIRSWNTNTSWTQIETSQGVYDWTTLDAWLSLQSSHGKDLMYTFGFVPHWASMRPSETCPYMVSDPGCAAPPSDVDSGDNVWKAFVTALVKHSLSSPELHIASYELWNEPDLLRDWTGTPAQLVTMAKDAYAIIHELDPSAKVIGPAPSTANQFGVHFLPAYYAAGGATAQDIVGMHAYLYDGGTFSSSPAGITTTIAQLKLLMATYGISNQPIWFTEGNWGNTNDNVMTNAQKAAYVAQEHLLIWSSGVVSRYYWFSWDATSFGTLWSASSGVQPAGVAYGRVANWLIGSVHQDTPCTESADATWTCNLTLASGYPAEILWNASLTKTITVSAAFATYETIDSTTVQAISGHEVTVGNAPIMIVGSQAVQ